MPYTVPSGIVEYTEIGSVPLTTTGWRQENVSELWKPADQRGEDVLIPGADGVLPQLRRKTVTRRSLFVTVFGDYSGNNVVAADPRAQVRANLADLKANVVDPTGTGDGTRAVTLHLIGGGTLTGFVHVLGMDWAKVSPTVMRAAITVSLPFGELM